MSCKPLTWDKEGHLASLTEGAQTTSYIYDTAGQRLIANNGNKTVLYLPDGTELEKDTNGTILGQRYYGVAVRDAAGLKWIITNHQGTGTSPNRLPHPGRQPSPVHALRRTPRHPTHLARNQRLRRAGPKTTPASPTSAPANTTPPQAGSSAMTR